jgi:hypothetical protein
LTFDDQPEEPEQRAAPESPDEPSSAGASEPHGPSPSVTAGSGTAGESVGPSAASPASEESSTGERAWDGDRASGRSALAPDSSAGEPDAGPNAPKPPKKKGKNKARIQQLEAQLQELQEQQRQRDRDERLSQVPASGVSGVSGASGVPGASARDLARYRAEVEAGSAPGSARDTADPLPARGRRADVATRPGRARAIDAAKADDGARPGAGPLWWVALGVLVVLVVLAGSYAFAQRRHAQDLTSARDQRQTAGQAAGEFAQTLFTYDSTKPTASLTHLAQLASKAFRPKIEAARSQGQGSTTTAHFTIKAEPVSVYVDEPSGNHTTAVCVVSLTLKAGTESETHPVYVEVELVRESGTWKVDQVTNDGPRLGFNDSNLGAGTTPGAGSSSSSTTTTAPASPTTAP